ncbi:hypothetical protein MPER_02859, partial [Moniliophthora perniciosa FA553]
PISVTIHVRNSTSHIYDFLDSLHALYTSSPVIAQNVDVHLVIDFFDRQFNTWRNIARFFARTDYVMMLDIDFYLCTDFRKAIRGNGDVMKMLREGYSAFVIPAFEYLEHGEGVDYENFPKDKQVGASYYLVQACVNYSQIEVSIACQERRLLFPCLGGGLTANYSEHANSASSHPIYI